MAATKYSRQRESIKNFLLTRADHPTADIVYLSMRETYPNISLGTVYRNLSLLADKGEIQRIHEDGGDRFDANTAPHYHLRCRVCHRMDDLTMPFMQELNTKAAACCAGKIETHTIIFQGLCSSCSRREAAQKKS